MKSKNSEKTCLFQNFGYDGEIMVESPRPDLQTVPRP